MGGPSLVGGSSLVPTARGGLLNRFSIHFGGRPGPALFVPYQ